MKTIITILLISTIIHASFIIESWCMGGDCFKLKQPVEIAIIDNPKELCGDSFIYEIGCAILDKRIAVVKHRSDNETLATLTHELLHFYYWDTERTAEHNEELVKRDCAAHGFLNAWPRMCLR